MKAINVRVEDKSFMPVKAHASDAAYDLRLNIKETSNSSIELVTRIIEYHDWLVKFSWQDHISDSLHTDPMPRVFINAEYCCGLELADLKHTLLGVIQQPYVALAPGMYVSKTSHDNLTYGISNVELVGTGVYLDLPDNYYATVLPRSGLGVKHQITLANTVGVIDSGYRGEIKLGLQNLGRDIHIFTKSGKAKVAQLLIHELAMTSLQISEQLSTSARGNNGFGSTGV
jgi:dUTP pyrophosphatase